MKILLVAALSCALVGCASITRGTTNDVTVTTVPPGAAVRTSMNHTCVSPCTFKVGRKDEFVVTASMPGYRDASTPVKTRVAGSGAAGFAGNILVGGVIGMGVDAATGAALEHYPSPVAFTMEREAPAVSDVKPPRRGAKPRALAFKPEADTAPAAAPRS
jgi:hypothetical protein